MCGDVLELLQWDVFVQQFHWSKLLAELPVEDQMMAALLQKQPQQEFWLLWSLPNFSSSSNVQNNFSPTMFWEWMQHSRGASIAKFKSGVDLFIAPTSF
jgi:hypothetical protein